MPLTKPGQSARKAPTDHPHLFVRPGASKSLHQFLNERLGRMDPIEREFAILFAIIGVSLQRGYAEDWPLGRSSAKSQMHSRKR